MYLKSIEVIGFKSFADRTVLQFEPGMTAIVGPNGCGKSNIADAVRWVLGEQSAKALRGTKMEDCIFNGTDARKPLGMAELNITFANCESVLGVDYNEVTIGRRVFRSGEGQYFVNRTPCRLKDIQRLFMNTGIGTTSYSLMEQGRIDRVLSSRPEDRREIFEEASGITRFKADKHESLRKLEQTEANLLRLSDVIREVKRQIGSLQRQAGKARRYKELRARLAELDLYRTGQRLAEMDRDLAQMHAEVTALAADLQGLHADIQQSDTAATRLRGQLMETEHALSALTEQRTRAQSQMERTHDLLRMNRDRVRELQVLETRDLQDLADAGRQADKQRQALDALTGVLAAAQAERDRGEEEWQARNTALNAQQARQEALQQEIQSLRAQSMELEAEAAALQNQLAQMETRERADLIQRERLMAERSNLTRIVADAEERLARLTEALHRHQDQAATIEAALKDLRTRRVAALQGIDTAQHNVGAQQSALAAVEAQIHLLTAEDRAAQDFPDGAKRVLDPANPLRLRSGSLLGSLASQINVLPEFHTALEAALRAWLDAVVVAQAADALEVVRCLSTEKGGPARLLALEHPSQPLPDIPLPPGATRLLDHVQSTPPLQPLVQRLLAGVIVVHALDAAATPLPRHAVYVTRTGTVQRGDGAYEYWTADARLSNPLSRKHQVENLQRRRDAVALEVESSRQSLDTARAELQGLEHTIEERTTALAEARHALALKEGENEVVSRETQQSQDRLETVSGEIDNLAGGAEQNAERQRLAQQINTTRDRQAAGRAAIERKTAELHEAEKTRSALYAEATDLRVRFAERRQRVEHLAGQQEPIRTRVQELEGAVATRQAAVANYRATLEQLTRSIQESEAQTVALEKTLGENAKELEALQKTRATQTAALSTAEQNLGRKRGQWEDLSARKSALDVALAENKLRRQNMIDRITGEFAVAEDQVRTAPEPAWEKEQPSVETFDAMIAEIRARIDEMGPVNLGAAEEYDELEERYAFLTRQQDDLVNAKQQLMDMIRSINRTTAEMFSGTFTQINLNFQTMFQRLFDGGTARLVLADDQDVLEAGIDIIARPPGKRMQSISLLSGGERTLTAVALLFAIYMIKPSPFCILDELDAPLDESNIGRFLGVLRDFLNQSQFVVITHNRKTIGAASVIYGVTMEETGVSRVISMKFSEYEKNRDRYETPAQR